MAKVDGDGVLSLVMAGVMEVSGDGVQVVGVVVDSTNPRFLKKVKLGNPRRNQKEKQMKKHPKKTKPK